MACKKIYNFIYLTGFRIDSNESGLSNCIAYVTVFIILVDKIKGEQLDFDMSP